MTILNNDQLLKACGGRLTTGDINLLANCARSYTSRPCKTLVEIGSAGGCSTVILARVAQDTGGTLYCIEPQPEGRWYPNIEPYKDSIVHIKGWSPWIDPKLINLPIDFLFIDGNHKTKWVITDYQYWSAFVRVGGIIAFHDWNEARPGTDGFQVKRALDIIMETDADMLEMVMEAPGKADRGSIAFGKLG